MASGQLDVILCSADKTNCSYDCITMVYTVQGQRANVALVEDNVNTAGLHVQHASLSVQTASRLQLYALPVGGAILGGLVGGVMGGPVGAFAGVKVGAITAAAGGAAGAIGGALVGLKAKALRRWKDD